MLFPFQKDKIVTMTVLYDTESVLQSSFMIGSKRDTFLDTSTVSNAAKNHRNRRN